MWQLMAISSTCDEVSKWKVLSSFGDVLIGMILMHGVMVMKVLSKQLTMQTFVEHSKKHYPFVKCIEKLFFFCFTFFKHGV